MTGTVMCPSLLMPLGIDVDLTDEELILFLGGWSVGDPNPLNVITEVNPFMIEPWDSPEGTWFLYNSKESQPHNGANVFKVTKNGYWKSTGDLKISASSTTVGRKITREFYIGHAPFGDKTGWMMHQYQAENMLLEGNSKGQDSSSLCRLFFQFDEWPNNKEECDPTCPEQCNPVSCEQCDPGGPEEGDPISPELCDPASPELSDPVGVESMLMRYLEQEERNSRDVANRIQAVGEDEQTQLELLGVSPQDFVPLHGLADVDIEDDMHTSCDFSKGDFLELEDLYDSESSSTSSDNSSLMLMNSDDCFDAEALLRDIENESDLNMDQTISTSVRSNHVVIGPQTSADNSCSNLVVSHSGSATMDSQSDGDSSVSGSSGGSQADEARPGSSEASESRSVRRIAKLGKRYCCFAPF